MMNLSILKTTKKKKKITDNKNLEKEASFLNFLKNYLK